MKRILLASAAIASLGTAAFAIDGDDKQQTRVRVADNYGVVVAGDGPIVELRGENGERTLHIERDGFETELLINGQRVEIHDGTVTVDGQAVEASPNSVVVIEGNEIRVVDGGFETRFDGEFELHMAERAEHLARMHEDMDAMVFDVDIDGIHADVMTSLQATLEDLDGDHYYRGHDWDELSDEEREEVREALREAREEVREAMREVRVEMREAEREQGEMRRHMRVEIRRAGEEMARAEREMARAEREMERAVRDAERAEREIVRMRIHRDGETMHGEDHATILRRHRDGEDIHVERRDVRIEQDDSGRRRVWINGEEQEGDDLVNWLNRLESDRLDGARDDRRAERHAERRAERHVYRFDMDGDDEVIELDGGERVVILRREVETDDDN